MQALGGYGYTKEYMVEKIKRDVRITTIYEGTSEIMEMTIGRDRWQQHLKTRGEHYHREARDLEALHGRQPAVGAAVAALALHALAEVFERARAARLTRHQHVLLRLGELAAWAECAAAAARHAADAAFGRQNPRSGSRFDAVAQAAMSRVFARESALRVATDGLRLVCGATSNGAADAGPLAADLRLPAIQAAQAGLLADLDLVADVLYGRAGATQRVSA
jgi:alkylation response protein AidB-like acyl-CoA dehydrogenase